MFIGEEISNFEILKKLTHDIGIVDFWVCQRELQKFTENQRMNESCSIFFWSILVHRAIITPINLPSNSSSTSYFEKLEVEWSTSNGPFSVVEAVGDLMKGALKSSDSKVFCRFFPDYSQARTSRTKAILKTFLPP